MSFNAICENKILEKISLSKTSSEGSERDWAVMQAPLSLCWWPIYSKTCVKRPLSNRPKIGFQDQLWLNAGQKYFRMLSAILLTFIKLSIVIKIFVLSIFEWLFYTGFTVNKKYQNLIQ